ncbi:MAG: hypothetical protein ACRELS_21410 [Candidatus Rokuibacteriota bacterium]
MKTLACAWCISSAFGDRTFNWPYLSLIVAPFLVVAVIAAVVAWQAGIRPRTLVQRLTRRHEPPPHKETT